MTIAFIRGAYLNNFELQSYEPLLNDSSYQMTGFSSLYPMHTVKLPVIKLPSPLDLPNFPYKLPILNRLFGDAMYLWGLESAIKGYDIAHVRETYFHFSKQAIWAKKKGYVKKVLVTCSETIVGNHEGIWGRKQIKQAVITNADLFHCLTQRAKDCLIAEGVAEQKIRVIPYGIDMTRFKNPKNRLPKVRTAIDKKGNFNILFLGRLEDQKGVNELMNAYRMVKVKHPQVELKVVGKGPLDWMVKENGIQPEFYPYDQISQVMSGADLLVLPSKPTKHWEEYFGMVLLEAMASGLPILTTKCGAIPEVVGNSALVVAHSHAGRLAEGIEHLIHHPKWLNTLSQRGIERMKKLYDATKQAKQLGELYHELSN